GGTGSPAFVISATPAPLPPSRSRILALPSEKRYTHLRGDCFTASSRVMSVVCATGSSSSSSHAGLYHIMHRRFSRCAAAGEQSWSRRKRPHYKRKYMLAQMPSYTSAIALGLWKSFPG